MENYVSKRKSSNSRVVTVNLSTALTALEGGKSFFKFLTQLNLTWVIISAGNGKVQGVV